MTKNLQQITEEIVGEFDKEFVYPSGAVAITPRGVKELKDFIHSAILKACTSMRDECVVGEIASDDIKTHLENGFSETGWNAARKATIDNMNRFMNEK